jgi:hypothetical protein
MQKYFFDLSITFTVFQFYDTGQYAFMVTVKNIHTAVQYVALYGLAQKGKKTFFS